MDAALFDLLLEKLNRLVKETNKIRNGKDAILEKWLDNQEVCEILGISKRTLQTLRDTGKLAFTMIEHKIYYRPKDVETFINNHIKKMTAK
ncbi:MAG: helix-turn-helix domain-containing protein [Prevotella sp.]|jgi:carbamoylphosphate synthase small subunit|nr:helix-turn-helix domain-containing protein [Prevotella sp.]